MKNRNEGVQKAIEAAGGTYESLAQLLKCSTQAVRKMLLKNCTGERAVQIEEVTEGAVKREEIRPDLFVKGYKPVPHPVIPIPASLVRELEGVEKPTEVETETELEQISVDDLPEDHHHDTENLRQRATLRPRKDPLPETAKPDIGRPGRRTLRIPNSAPAPLQLGAVKSKT